MSNYQIIDVIPDHNQFTVLWDNAVTVKLRMPRQNGSWLSTSDLDRYIGLHLPPLRDRDPSSLSAEQQEQFTADRTWLESVLTEPYPNVENQLVIDQMITYAQQQFMNMVNQQTHQGGPWLFLDSGESQWTVPPDLEWARLCIFASGQDSYDQGPGYFWSSGCRFQPSDTVSIYIGTQTTVSSSLGTISVDSGWSVPNQQPRTHYRVQPWGHPGRTGAVIIF